MALLLILAFALTAVAARPQQWEVETIPVGLEQKRVEKVLVELYSESLCPYCSLFILNHLSSFFSNGLIDIVDLRIIPYGNAKIGPNGTFICQHGPDECSLNLVQTCAIKFYPNVNEWFPFIYCLEALPRAFAAEIWTVCASSSVVNVSLVQQCSQGEIGIQYEFEFAKLTSSLQPPHKYVPWVLVDGKPLYEDYEHVIKYVCEAYKGPEKKLPPVCSSPTHKVT